MNGHYFKSICNVGFSEPSSLACDFYQRDGVVDSGIVQREWFWWDTFINASDRVRVRRREERKIRRFFPEYLRVATPREFILKKEKGGELNGPIT